MFWREEFSAHNEDLSGYISVTGSVRKDINGYAFYLDEGGFVASTFPKS